MAFKLNAPQNENSPQLEEIGDSGGIIVDDGETRADNIYSLGCEEESL